MARNRVRAAFGLGVATLLVAAGVTAPSAAQAAAAGGAGQAAERAVSQAAVPCSYTGIDIGHTTVGGGYIRGSGSWSNCSGALAQVCLQIWWQGETGAGWGQRPMHNPECRSTPTGPGYAFSPPDTPCQPGLVWTRITSHNASGAYLDTKNSNLVDATAC